MAISSGVRAPRAQVMIGGLSFGVLSATVNQEATRRSSTMSASCALNTFPGGDAFFAGLSDNSGSITIDGVPLCSGEWDAWRIGYGESIVQMTGRDESISLHERKSSEKFNNQTRSDIVSTVAQRNGLQAQVAQETLMAGKLFQIDWAKLTDGISDAAIIPGLDGGSRTERSFSRGRAIVERAGECFSCGSALQLGSTKTLQQAEARLRGPAARRC
jgi:hypothetical protein